MRGILFNNTDVKMDADAIHGGGGQIMPFTRRCLFAVEMMAQPTSQEPVFLVDIMCPHEDTRGMCNCMNLRRGCVFEENPREGTPLVQVRTHLLVVESFGFFVALRQAASGQAFPQCVFGYWEDLQGESMDEGSKMQTLMLNIMKYKNGKLDILKLGVGAWEVRVREPWREV